MKTLSVDVHAVVKVPAVPNFVRLENGTWLPLCALSKQGIQNLGAAMTEAMIARAHEQSKDREKFYDMAKKGEEATT